jgi:hypothetical protein
MKGDFSRDTFDATKHYSRVLMQQGRVQLDADWNEQQSINQYRTVTEAQDVIGFSGAPLHGAGFKITSTDGKVLTVGQGRYYVDGVLCENESDVAYTAQPDLPNPPDIIAAIKAAQVTAAIIYLDVWFRHLTGLDDPLIRETALGGPDTASRIKTVWQVKALPAKPDSGTSVGCGDHVKAWDDLTTPSSGTLSARAQPTQPTDSPCLLPPSAGYRRLENQLYRVEIHAAGNPGQATFKWSRDNGAVVASVDKINGQDITVHDLGRDDVLGFASGQWVEVSDDAHELNGLPGQLVQIDHIDKANRIVSVKTAVTGIDFNRGARLRRWDGASATGLAVAVPATNDGFIALEDGVEVKFGAGTYAAGDYWLIPARTATGNVEWPFTTPQPPRGIFHRYARLAVATLVGDALTLVDCRNMFSPLTERPAALHVKGINWVNDDIVSQDLIINGLQVTFDSELTPATTDSSSAIATLTMEMPVVLGAAGVMNVGPGDGQIVGQVTTILDGDLAFSAQGAPNSPINSLSWKPTKNGAEFKTLIAALVTQRIARVRLRFVLKGHAIWRQGGPDLVYLDGRTLGMPGARADNSPRIDLVLPSGDGRRSSDFESWFYLQLQLPPSTLVGLSVSPVTVIAGTAVTGSVTVDVPPGAAGASVQLASSLAAITFSPNPVKVPTGQLQATFQITTSGITSTTEVLISGTETITSTTVPPTTTTVTKQAKLVVQVVSIAISPPELTLFTGRTQQFTATVSGADDHTVTWSITEGANGGSINTSGLYVAPATIGTFHVVAASVADKSKTATATVHVQTKPKEKEKDKEKETKEGKEAKEFALEKLHHQEVMSVPGRPILLPNEAMLGAGDATGGGRAFIRPAERPAVVPLNADPMSADFFSA